MLTLQLWGSSDLQLVQIPQAVDFPQVSTSNKIIIMMNGGRDTQVYHCLKSKFNGCLYKLTIGNYIIYVLRVVLKVSQHDFFNL